MNWSEIRPAILALVRSVSVIPANCVVWADQPQPYVDPSGRAICRLSILAATSQGIDDVTPTYDPDQPEGQEMAYDVSGNRLFTLSIKVESWDQADGRTASTYVEQIRDRFNRRSSGEALNSVGVSWYGENPAQDIPAQGDDRAKSITVLDLKMRARITESTREQPNGLSDVFGFIEEVDVNGSLSE